MSEIIQELLALQAREGWLRPESLADLAERMQLPLHRLESVSTFYTHFRREAPPEYTLEICRDLSCQMAGADEACARLQEWAGDRTDVAIRPVSCLGRCDAAPAAVVGDVLVDPRDPADVASQLDPAAESSTVRPVRTWPEVDPYAPAAESDTEGSTRLGEAYGVLRAALAAPPEAILEPLGEAGLRGMGGAGFPTARKWQLVAAEASEPKHVICNADESEPGTFKDREILHDLPHLVIEGMLLGAYCVGADRGTIFIRHEYAPELRQVEAAIAAARDAGALGEDIFGSGFSFELEVFVSPGGYILGEETALLECIEGRRGEPRNKPPFPGNRGLFGRPTLINNVETLAHAVGIVAHGAEWWHARGRDGHSGHKFMSVSGDVADPGVSLHEMGAPLSEVLDAHGGMKRDVQLAAVAPGGASSSFLGPEALEVALDFDAMLEAGSMLGSGAAIFMGTHHDLLDVGLHVTRFFRNESCGKCVPCRVGSEKAVALIEKAGGVSSDSEALLSELHETMQQTSICGLGQVALGPLRSILERFPDRIRRVEGD